MPSNPEATFTLGQPWTCSINHVKQKVDAGEVLLEWDYANGDPPTPLRKDEFGSERRKAKTLNFSIAYGKTAHGLSADWGVSTKEAQEMVDKWYDARPEVRDWQGNTKAYARRHVITRTSMGRYRQLPEAKSCSSNFWGTRNELVSTLPFRVALQTWPWWPWTKSIPMRK